MTRERVPTLAYILAASHSGSTLTALLLNAHPDICTAGELKISSLDDPATYRCSCRAKIHDCPFWVQVTENMHKFRHKFDVADARMHLSDSSSAYVDRLLKPLHRSPSLECMRDIALYCAPSWRQFEATWGRRNIDLIRSIATTSSAKIVVDSSKTGVRLKYLRRIPHLDVKVIRLVRDGRAVALTYMDSDNFADAIDPALRGGGAGQSNRKKLPMEQAAKRWLKSNLDAENALAMIPEEDSIAISYEHLCAVPGETLARIHDFLGLQANGDFARFREAPHHVIGNGMRLDHTSEIILDDRWRAVLTTEELETFNRIAGPLNRKYGYE